MATSRLRRVLRLVLAKRRQIFSVIVPLAFLPLIFQSHAMKCAYVTIIMIIYLITEALPMPISAFLPAIFFPVLGIQDAGSVATNYMSDEILFLIGVLMIACAAERTSLHKRFTLAGLRWVGPNPYRLMLCLMSLSSFLSMWLSNTAVASMMVPMGKAVADHMCCRRIHIQEDDDQEQVGGAILTREDESTMEMNSIMSRHETARDEVNAKEEPVLRRSTDNKGTALGSCISLSIAYGTTIGGSATLIGTVLPILLNAQLINEYGPGSSVGFDLWTAFALPLQFLCLVCSYLWMCLLLWWLLKRERARNSDQQECRQMYTPHTTSDRRSADLIQTYIAKEYSKLGRVKWEECWTLLILSILVGIWFFADLKFIRGWISLFHSKQVSITGVTLGFAALLFIIPLKKPRCTIHGEPKETPTILEWSYVRDAFPWGIIFVIGGYLALADGIKESGLGGLIQENFAWLSDADDLVVVLVITTVAAVSTEMIGNLAILVIFFPILVALAEKTQAHPWFYLIPLVLSCNLTFMLPIATPVNMVVYACGNVTVLQMARAGFALNIICLFFTNLLINTYGYLIFDFNTFPHWALTGTPAPTTANSSAI